MSQIFVQGAARMSFDGVAVFALDGSSPGTSVAFADQRISFVRTDNNAYPDLVDAQSFVVNKVPGVKIGQLQVSGVVQPDRSFHTFANSAFGPRTAGQLSPWLMNLVPYSGGAAIGATGIYWTSLRIFSSFAVPGAQSMVMFTATAVVVDPDNFYSAPTLTVPSYVGASGAGIASFARCAFNNDGATTYDEVRAFDIAFSNGMQVQPGMKNPVQRIANGCTPATIKGALTLTQLGGAVNPVPLAPGTYPIDVLIPTGDGTHTLTLATSQSYDSATQSYSPTDFQQHSANYSLFSTAAGSTATAAYPFIASYA